MINKLISTLLFKLIKELLLLLLTFLKTKADNKHIKQEVIEALNEEDRTKAAARINNLFK